MQNQLLSSNRRLDAAERSRLLALYRSGQLTQAAFAKQHGLNLHTLRQWLYRSAPTAPSKSGASEVNLRELSLGSLLPGAWAAEVALPSGINIRFGSKVSPELVAQLLAHLSVPC